MRMQTLQIRLTKELIEKIDEVVTEGIYPSRSEAVRDAVRKHINDFNKIRAKKAGRK